ncbi:MAG: HAD hydrolase family protein [Planctomycetota bacterium]|nr:HAD hydrolase family protein [Planctomycetota bacterium]
MTTPASRRFDAVICDIDGCLAPESTAPMDAPALARIAEYNTLAQTRRDRPVVTLCSGRPQPFVEALCRLLQNTTVPCVAENGVWLFDPRDSRFLIDPAITDAHLDAVEEAEHWVRHELGPRGVVIQPGKAASLSIWHPDTAMLKAMQPRLREEFAKRAWPLRVSATVAWINCDLAHISKASGVKRLVAETGLSRERLAGVGDMPSDQAIADNVSFFACPANADPTLARGADFVSQRHEVLGVLDILEHVRTLNAG